MRAEGCKPEQVANILRLVLGRKPNPKNELTIDELLTGNCFQVLDGEKQVGAYVLQVNGNEVWIQAAAGKSKYLSFIFDDLIDKHAAGFKSVAFRTYRAGLVKNAIKCGYEIAEQKDGFTMRKFLK